jgi:glycosyltransferase involved in cell wall biosynthesis
MKYSIVMPVHNMAEVLPRVLSALAAHTAGDHEIIVVIDGCTDSSESIVRSFP